MLKRVFLRRFAVSLFAISVSLGATVSAHAKSTINPMELVISGGFTANIGVSQSTKLFLDVVPDGPNQFWVRAENNPGAPRLFDEPVFLQTDQNGVQTLPPKRPTPTKTISIKYFPMSRFFEVLRATRGIRTFGTVNPYIDDFIICDAPNSQVRIWNRTVNMAYNCGSSGPDADAATFEAEALMKALYNETTQNPDLEGTVPQ